MKHNHGSLLFPWQTHDHQMTEMKKKEREEKKKDGGKKPNVGFFPQLTELSRGKLNLRKYLHLHHLPAGGMLANTPHSLEEHQ